MSESKPLQDETTPEHLRDGPVVDRKCTDIVCFIVFILFTILMFGIAIYAFKNGNPERLAQPYDPDHRACGVDSGVEDYPLIYFANPTDPRYLYVTTCVKSCPHEPHPDDGEETAEESGGEDAAEYYNEYYYHLGEEGSEEGLPDELDCATNSIVRSCKENKSSYDIVSNPGSVVLIYNSVPFMNRVCLPTAKQYFEEVEGSISSEKMETYFDDIKTSKFLILFSVIIAIAISFAFLFFLEKCTGPIVWLFIIMVFLLLLCGGIFSYTYYVALTNPNKLPESAKANIDYKTLQDNAYRNNTNPSLYKYLGIILLVMSGVYLLLLLCFCSRIQLAIAILKTASDFVQDNFGIVLVPLLTLFFIFGYFIFWLAIALYLYSTGQVSNRPHGLPFGQFIFTTDQKILGNIHLFGFFWNSCFIIAMVEFIVAGSVCNWYFDQQNQKNQHPVKKAIGRFFRYHVGTVAMGSFLLAVVCYIRFWLEYLYRNQEELRKKNKVFDYLFKCLICCMWCFEKCVQFINKNAYICTNMTGKSFCPAAMDAVMLIIRNPVRFAVTGGLGEIFVAVGRVFISALTGFVVYMILTRTQHFSTIVTYPEAPVLVVCVIAFIIGSNFMSIYGIACDAILFVFCMDEEMEKNKGGQALCCPKALREFLDKE